MCHKKNGKMCNTKAPASHTGNDGLIDRWRLSIVCSPCTSIRVDGLWSYLCTAGPGVNWSPPADAERHTAYRLLSLLHQMDADCSVEINETTNLADNIPTTVGDRDRDGDGDRGVVEGLALIQLSIWPLFGQALMAQLQYIEYIEGRIAR